MTLAEIRDWYATRRRQNRAIGNGDSDDVKRVGVLLERLGELESMVASQHRIIVEMVAK